MRRNFIAPYGTDRDLDIANMGALLDGRSQSLYTMLSVNNLSTARLHRNRKHIVIKLVHFRQSNSEHSN